MSERHSVMYRKRCASPRDTTHHVHADNPTTPAWAQDGNEARTETIDDGKGPSLMRVVELGGFEPPTFSLRTRRATNCAIAPSADRS